MVIGAGLVIYGYFANDNHSIQYLGFALLILSAYSYAKGITNAIVNFADKPLIVPNIGTISMGSAIL